MTRMAEEIAAQPAVLAGTLDGLLPRRAELRALADGRRHVLVVGRGTSDNAALYGRYLFEIHAGIGATSAAPSLVTHYAVERDLRDTLVLCVSQSGETAEIVGTQRWARERGAATVAVTNGATSTLAGEADVALVTAAGRELAVPATKSYTAQLAAIAVVADAMGPVPSALEGALRAVPDEVARLIRDRDGVDEAIAALEEAEVALASGRGLVFGTSLEVALKLEETCLRPVRGLSYADLRHGPIAVVDHRAAAILVAAQDGPMLPGIAQLADDLSSLGARTIAIGGDRQVRDRCHVHVAGPQLPELVAPLGLIVPAQLVAEGLSRRLGLDPDEPRGLRKVSESDPDGGTRRG